MLDWRIKPWIGTNKISKNPKGLIKVEVVVSSVVTSTFTPAQFRIHEIKIKRAIIINKIEKEDNILSLRFFFEGFLVFNELLEALEFEKFLQWFSINMYTFYTFKTFFIINKKL